MLRLSVVILTFLYFCDASDLLAKDRIIGGIAASIINFPFQCSLQKLDNHACGCSIYNKNVVITAAHCVFEATQSDINHMKIRAGSDFWSTGGVVKEAHSILVHPSYDPITMANDVALVKVKSDLNFSRTIKPVELADSYPSEGSDVVVTGWGYSKEDKRAMVPKLMKTTVKYITGKTCASSKYKYNQEILDGMICGDGGESDACQGDSGGPLTDPDTFEQVGIVSWGYGCAQDGHPGIYTDVVAFAPWIKKNANAMK